MSSFLKFNRIIFLRCIATGFRNYAVTRPVYIEQLVSNTHTGDCYGEGKYNILNFVMYCFYLVALQNFRRNLSTETSPKDDDYHNIIKNTENPIGKNSQYIYI